MVIFRHSCSRLRLCLHDVKHSSTYQNTENISTARWICAFFMCWIRFVDTIRFAGILANSLIKSSHRVILTRKCYRDATQEIQLLRMNFCNNQKSPIGGEGESHDVAAPSSSPYCPRIVTVPPENTVLPEEHYRNDGGSPHTV